MPSAPVLDGSGARAGDAELAGEIFAAEVRPHLVHETVRAELNERRSGTRAAKSRGLVSGGRSKPWRQKGTGRARQGTIRAPQFRGGGVAFPPATRSFAVKVNRKARRAALRSALSAHVSAGTLGVLDSAGFDAPETRRAAALVAAWGQEPPLLVVVAAGEEAVAKSFRNLERTVVTVPAELEVSALVWARSLLITRAALDDVRRRAEQP